MISIHAPITDVSSLSVKASKILAWIPGSLQWLQQAINDASANYAFTSETALLDSILTGLHSTKLLPVGGSGVMAAPQFLMMLSLEQLQILALSLPEKNTEVFAELGKTTGAVTAWHNLQAATALETLGVDRNGLFTTMSIRDISCLSQLQQILEERTYPQSVYLEAAKFALQTACSAESFCQLTEFAIAVYGYLVTKHRATKITPRIATKFNTLYQDLLSKAMQHLRCPQLAANQSVQEVGAVLQYWGQRQWPLGFTDMPTALVNWIRYFKVADLFEDLGKYSLLEEYSQALLLLQQWPQIRNRVLTQDGSHWRFTINESKPGITPPASTSAATTSGATQSPFTQTSLAVASTASTPAMPSAPLAVAGQAQAAPQAVALECAIVVDEAGCISVSRLQRNKGEAAPAAANQAKTN